MQLLCGKRRKPVFTEQKGPGETTSHLFLERKKKGNRAVDAQRQHKISPPAEQKENDRNHGAGCRGPRAGHKKKERNARRGPRGKKKGYSTNVPEKNKKVWSLAKSLMCQLEKKATTKGVKRVKVQGGTGV